jgi:trehalose 6-phosphate synthase/phosphatase
LIQITNPRASNTAKLQLRISEQVSMINGQYGNLEFLPVHYHSREIRSEDYYALMNIADAALITSVRDGMNTMSYEWVVCQNDKATSDNGPGVLILSEFCGTAGSLSGALHINPWDVEGVADAIHDALRMPVENRRAKFALLDAHVRSYTASFWATCFLNELDQHSDEFECDPSPRVLDISSLSAAYTAAKGKRLFLFDYDGTLTPIRQFPHEAAPSPLALSALTKLAAHEQNYVWIISGRDQATLEAWINIPNVGLSAEHGCYIRSPRSTTWIDLTDGMDISWQEEVMRVFEYYTERTLGSFIERKKSSITWHYRQADPDFGSFQAKECQNHLEEVLGKMPVEVMTGKKNLEVRPAALNKGGIVGRLVRGHGQWCGEAKDDLDLIVCCGDDRTDEDMFKVLRRRRRKLSSLSEDERDEECTSTFCIAIGDKTKKTVASWRLPGAEQLVQVLSALE